MAGYVVSECTLVNADLPAKHFDDKWITATHFLKFSNPVNLKGKIDNMREWIENFDKQILIIYDADSLGDIRDKQDKRCRDLNYYINYVLHYIPEITKDTENVAQIIQEFQTYLNAIFTKWEKFSIPKKFDCKREVKEYTSEMDLIKSLDDYCENRNAFKNKLTQYNKIICCKYSKHVNEMKRFFHKYISSNQLNKDDESFNIEENCSLKTFGKTFPNVACNNNSMSEIETDEIQIPPGYENLIGNQQTMSTETHPEDSFNSSPTKIALTSVSTLLGACLSGLYLYRRSFVRGILRNFQKKNHISNEDTYDDVNGMFSESPSHYLSTPAESNRFYISYDSTNN
ncbi:PIR Superfamily Protein [Plasmodium ovale curtisi]|uniref:PIR Superfamily Protein n=1 Tax=Plasmodium ovale curtisi TaxID=864141 RepID=A0A1A8WK14_PLAOA|nr:PIR Superfamily Protein [Plasmodium ovale curtisi]